MEIKMQLRDIRQQFIELTGRYDFIEIPAKADFFINAGMQLLDRKVTSRHIQESVSFNEAPPDVGIVQIPRCWQVHQVWSLDARGEGTRFLMHRTEQTNRFTNFWRNIGAPLPRTSKPTHYSILTTRNEQQLEKLETLDLQIPANYVHTGEWNGWVLSLELFPHQHQKCIIEVHGKYYTPPLIKDTDTNIWSQFYPSLLVKAACHVLEVFYRNTEGAQDWLVSIADELIDIEKMEVETDMRKYSVMEG